MITTKTSSCCGGYVTRKRARTHNEIQPVNPKVNGGVGVIYLGAGNFKVKGKSSGLTYYASDHHRHLKIDPEDVKGILSNGEFILEP